MHRLGVIKSGAAPQAAARGRTAGQARAPSLFARQPIWEPQRSFGEHAAPFSDAGARAVPPPLPGTTGASRLLQRKCACGSDAGIAGECEACRGRGTGLQKKLQIGAPDDAYEHEADRVVDAVVHQDAPGDVAPAPPRIQRITSHPGGEAGEVPGSVERTLAGAGSPLAPRLRRDMEHRFGHDFSQVRVHSDAQAGQSARDVDARAYTVGHHVVFGAGEFAPATAPGRRLLAHELTHVVQQSGARALRADRHPSTGGLAPHSAPHAPVVRGVPVLARKPLPDNRPFPIKTMPYDEARLVLVDYISRPGLDDALAAKIAIQETLDLSSSRENWRWRLRLLTAAFSLVQGDDAAWVLKALTAPSGTGEAHLHRRFLRIDQDFTRPLLAILRERVRAKPAAAAAAEQKDKPVEKPAERPAREASVAGKATWIEVSGGVFAYVPMGATTIDNIAAYVSGNPDLPDVLADLNKLKRTAPIPAERAIIVPLEFIDRMQAFREMPADIGQRMYAARQQEQDNKTVHRLIEVRGGHPLGPVAVGLIPLTTLAIRQIATGMARILEQIGYWVVKGLAYAIAFVVGVVHGFLGSIWDTVAGFFHVIYDVLKSIFTLSFISDIRDLVSAIGKLSWKEIKDAVGDWATKWADELDDPNPLVAGHAHGYLTGYVMAEAAMLLLSGGALEELKGIVWASKFGEALKGSRAAKSLAAAVKTAAEVQSAVGEKWEKALEAIRKSRIGTAVKVAEKTAAVVKWTAATVGKVLKLPQDIAVYVVEKAVAAAPKLEKYFDRIGELSARAKKWLFGCHSPCDWEADAVAATMEQLPTNREIEKAAELAEAQRAKPPATQPHGDKPAPAVEHKPEPPPAEPAGPSKAGPGAARQGEQAVSESQEVQRRLGRRALRKELRQNLQQRVEDIEKRIAELNAEKGRVQRELREIADQLSAIGKERRTAQNSGDLLERQRKLLARREVLKTYEAKELGTTKDLGSELQDAKKLLNATEADYFKALSSAASKKGDYAAVKAIAKDEVFGTTGLELEVEHVYPRSRIFDTPGFEKLSWDEQVAVFNYKPNLKLIPAEANLARGAMPYSEFGRTSSSRFAKNAQAIQEMSRLELEMEAKIGAMVKDPKLIPMPAKAELTAP